MSPQLPPADAPLAEKLRAAMLAAGYVNRHGNPDAYRLAKELRTDSGLVYKWLGGGKVTIGRIQDPSHLKKLPRLLETPENYFVVRDAKPTRLEEVAGTVADLLEWRETATTQIAELRSRLNKLEGPSGAVASGPKRPRKAKR